MGLGYGIQRPTFLLGGVDFSCVSCVLFVFSDNFQRSPVGSRELVEGVCVIILPEGCFFVNLSDDDCFASNLILV